MDANGRPGRRDTVNFKSTKVLRDCITVIKWQVYTVWLLP